MKTKLSGVFIPVVTSFIDEKLSVEKIESNLCKWNQTAVKGYMVLGTNGEFRSLDDRESLEVIRCAAGNRAPGKVLIAGAGRESTLETMRFVEKAQRFDVDYISLLTPHYFKGAMTDSALIRYFIDIAGMSAKPVLLYAAPGYANTVGISVNVVKKVAGHPNIHGIKDTSPNMMSSYCIACGRREDFAILSGSLATFLHGLMQGAVGGVLSAANYVPERCCALYDLYAAGKYDEAVALSLKLIDLYQAASKKYGVAGVKCCMDVNGYFGGDPRLPLLPISKDEKDQSAERFKRKYKDLL